MDELDRALEEMENQPITILTKEEVERIELDDYSKPCDLEDGEGEEYDNKGASDEDFNSLMDLLDHF